MRPPREGRREELRQKVGADKLAGGGHLKQRPLLSWVRRLCGRSRTDLLKAIVESPCIVHQSENRRMVRAQTARKIGHRFEISEVGQLQGKTGISRSRLDRAQRFLPTGLVPADEYDGRPTPREPFRGGPPDPGSRPRDDDDLAGHRCILHGKAPIGPVTQAIADRRETANDARLKSPIKEAHAAPLGPIGGDCRASKEAAKTDGGTIAKSSKIHIQ
jgi:hypothetical protein